MELIDKDALIAEIKRRLDKLANTSSENNREFSAIIGAQHYELISLVQYINTLEVKEEKESTDAFIEKAKEFIWSHTEGSDYHVNYVLKEFENFMKGE